MKEATTSKEKVLKKVRNALITKTPDAIPDVDFDSPVHVLPDEPLEELFADRFTALTGQFMFAIDHSEIAGELKAILADKGVAEVYCREEKLQKVLQKAGVAYSGDEITRHRTTFSTCEFLIARTGSVMVSSAMQGRGTPVYPDFHFIIAHTSQLVPDIKDALKGMKAKYNDRLPTMISLITGPSRTADIEKTLVIGAHGAKEIIVILTDEPL